MAEILAIATGGTIDAEKYGDAPPEFSSFNSAGKSAALSTLEKLGGNYVKTTLLYLKDSKHLTEENLIEIVSLINSSNQLYVIITHGTDKMVENANVIALNVKNKTVFFVGAMWPLANVDKSDGLKNIEYALMNIKNTAPGVYVIGKQNNSDEPGLFTYDNVRKDKSTITFKTLK